MDNVDDLVYRPIKKSDHNVRIKKLTTTARIPTRGSADAAGFDLYADLKDELLGIEIQPHQTVLVGLGIAMALPDNTFLAIYPRSGLAAKSGLRPANCVGVIDSDYRGEIKVAVHNDSNVVQYIGPGERIAQGILQMYIPMKFKEVTELDKTERGDGSFGSTGKD